jgi:hypothetical protein
MSDSPGWLELKAPGTGTDPQAWSGRNKQQWQLLAELDNLLLCDCQHLQLYRNGEPDSEAVALYVEGLREDGESLDSGVIRRSIPLPA